MIVTGQAVLALAIDIWPSTSGVYDKTNTTRPPSVRRRTHNDQAPNSNLSLSRQ